MATKKILVKGGWKKTGAEIKVLSPYDNSLVGSVYLAGAEELEEAVSSALEVFGKLKEMASHKKAEILEGVAGGIAGRAKELAKTIALEAGKPIKDARREVERAENTFKLAAEEAERMGGEVLPLDITAASEGRTGVIRRFPVGPVLGITPFNFPLNLVAHKIAPAMASGCPIILKPAPKTPLTALLLGEIISEAGCPAGAVNIVPASVEDIQKLIKDDRIKNISFTGSAEVGWALKAQAGRKRVTLELGGNAGAVVCRDADIEYAAKRCAAGAFSYAGQICISVQRIYVQKEIFERFKRFFLEECAKLKLGDPLDEKTDVGPMIDAASLERTEGWVEEAVSQGAKVLTGGRREKSFFEPTVLTGTRPSMKVCGSELFAPVVTLDPFDGFKEAVLELNSGLYGLQAGIFTNDINRAFYAYNTLDVGGVIINDAPTFRTDNMPYGGVKMSGLGREGVRYAIEEMTEIKILVLKTGGA